MNPRFLAESAKGMLQEPKIIESGRETVEGFKTDEKREREELLFCCRSVQADFPSSMFLCRLARMVTSLRGADFWSCASSAKS